MNKPTPNARLIVSGRLKRQSKDIPSSIINPSLKKPFLK